MYHTDKVFHAENKHGWWEVYTDLTKKEIEKVEGTGTVRGLKGEFSIWIDPRFDADKVIQELHKLALDNYLKDQGGYFPECGCDVCKARRVLDKCDCKVEPKIHFGHCKPIESCKVYMNGEEVVGEVELVEDMVLVPVKYLEAIQENMAQIRKNSWTIDDAQEHQTSLSYSVTNLIRKWLGK